MAANIVSPAQSGRFYYGCAGARRAAGGHGDRILVSSHGQLVAVRIWCVSTTLCRMLCDSGWRVSRIFRWWPTPP